MTWVGFFNREMKNTKLGKLLAEMEANPDQTTFGVDIDTKSKTINLPVEQEPTTRLTTETIIKLLTVMSMEHNLTTFEAFFDFETNTMTLKGFKDDQ